MAWLRRNVTLRYGIPMVLLVTGGSFGLREFAQIRYDYQKLHRKMDPDLEAKLKKSTTLESEYEKIQNSTFDDWKSIRGPRPWEDSITVQAQQKALSSKSS
ncbi:PREDICTED: cytochrome c oxidase assembly protein COX16 homolog, mitochondrial [Crocodylus porosus]|uniref:cytochrome c oxidase assembly protein COX16 homolog, mitochondrial n=1 Tax=Crocodylus porosus TaxID=8502 RepID=UPI000939E1B7|nr:PREDICTED: cytochrome c oxidase assembly protein COX16 homolog, mitochondrial [Crocodylus porosus]